MAVEFFRETGKGFAPKASVRKEGQIGLNQGAIKRFKLNMWKFVVLGFDRDENKIVIQLTNSDDEDGRRPLRVRETSASISAKAFFDYFDIPHARTEKYDVVRDDVTGFLEIILQDEGT
ncbi:MAG: hypothetical protein ACYS8X_13275 [Planctomycetota bacterium]|jgi:hypothetical protein